MNSLNWVDLGNNINNIYEKFHSKKLKLSVKQRLIGIAEEFSNIIENVKKIEIKNAAKYVKKRNKINDKLSKIQDSIKKEIETFIPLSKVYPASSFTAGTHLINDSDIDLNIVVDNLDQNKIIELSNICGINNFKFIEIRSKDDEGLHYVFQKFIDNVEIELKLRLNKDYYMEINNKMHNYIDYVMSNEDKIIITWIKYNLKNTSKKNYNSFKALYYENALANEKIYKLLYPII